MVHFSVAVKIITNRRLKNSFHQHSMPLKKSIYFFILDIESIQILSNLFIDKIYINYVILSMNRLQKIRDVIVPTVSKSEFIYTTDRGILTHDQRKFYEDNGYIVLRNFLKDSDIQKWRTRFLEYCDQKIQPYMGMQIVRDISLVKKNKGKKLIGEANITKLQDFQQDQILHTYCTNPDLIPYLKSFCGQNIKSVHTMFINKPPGMGGSSRHPYHQDLAYFPFGPTNNIVAAWASLEDANKQNGSLKVFPGTHKGQFYMHEYPEDEVNKAYFGITKFDKQENKGVDLQMKKGDIVLFHPLLVHGSGQNRSKGYRKSFCCHFASSECQYIPIEGTVQGVIAKEVMDFTKRKYGNFLPDYHAIWKMKAKLVCGQQFEGFL